MKLQLPTSILRHATGGAGFEADLDDVLRQNRIIAHIWCPEDVRSLRPDLGEDEAYHVLTVADSRLDSGHGLDWDLIEGIADELYPEPQGKGADL